MVQEHILAHVTYSQTYKQFHCNACDIQFCVTLKLLHNELKKKKTFSTFQDTAFLIEGWM